MTCQTSVPNKTCSTITSTCGSSLFESTREARLEALARQKRDEEERKAQIARLNQIRQSIAVRDAKEQARYQALQDAEKAFKIRERDILEKQLEETLAMAKRMQDQYEEFVVTTAAIAKKLENPADLFKVSTIIAVDEFKDYFKVTYKDGRIVKIPFAALDYMLKAKMDAINCEFEAHTEQIIQLQTDLADQAEQITKMSDLFKTLVANVASHETDQNIAFEEFKCEVRKELDAVKEDVNTIAVTFASLTKLVESLNTTVSSLVEA